MEKFESQETGEKKPVLKISEETKRELAELFHGAMVNGEKLPPVSLLFFSGPHGSVEDAQGVETLLDSSDIYIPELYGWNEDVVSLYNDISNGKISLEETLHNVSAFDAHILSHLQGAKKPITFIDVPMMGVSAELLDSGGLPLDGKLEFSTLLPKMEKMNALWLKDTIKKREEYMVKTLARKVEEAVISKPELLHKSEIKVLLTLGAAHSAIYHELRKVGGSQVKRTYKSAVTVFTQRDELLRRQTFGKESSESLEQKSIFESYLSDGFDINFDRISMDTQKQDALVRYLCSLFTKEEMEEVFAERKKVRSKGGKYRPYLESWLSQKGVVLPKDETELDTLLSATKYSRLINNNQKNDH